MSASKNRFQMKIPSFVIEGVFIASRRRLHRPTKVSSQNSGIGCRLRGKKTNRIGRIEERYPHKNNLLSLQGEKLR